MLMVLQPSCGTHPTLLVVNFRVSGFILCITEKVTNRHNQK